MSIRKVTRNPRSERVDEYYSKEIITGNHDIVKEGESDNGSQLRVQDLDTTR